MVNTDSTLTVSPDVRALLDHIAAVPEGNVWCIDQGDPFHKEHAPIEVMKVSELIPTAEELRAEILEPLMRRFADFYDFTGRRVPYAERTEEWKEAHLKGGEWPDLRIPNAAVLFGDDIIMVSRGDRYVVGETTRDGEVAFEFATGGEYASRIAKSRRERRDAWIAANPVVSESKPWWAEGIDIENDDERPGVVLVTYVLSPPVDDLYLTQEAEVDGGTLTFTSKPTLQNGPHELTEWPRIGSKPSLAGALRAFGGVLDKLASVEKAR